MIVFCSCSFKGLVDKETLANVAGKVATSGKEYVVVDDLCRIAAKEKEKLVGFNNATVIACFPRAVEALFETAGVKPDKVYNIRNISVSEGTQPAQDGNAILEDMGFSDNSPKTDVIIPEPVGEWIPWFPTIDRERCVGCARCFDYCLFGVYTIEDKKVVVSNPDQCKNNCPACARVCPEKAIIFPKYPKSFINGGLTEEEPTVDIDELVKNRELYKQLQARNQNRNRLVK